MKHLQYHITNVNISTFFTTRHNSFGHVLSSVSLDTTIVKHQKYIGTSN